MEWMCGSTDETMDYSIDKSCDAGWVGAGLVCFVCHLYLVFGV